MFNNLEIIGNFMHAQSAYLQLLALLRSVQLDISPIKSVRAGGSYARDGVPTPSAFSIVPATLIRSEVSEPAAEDGSLLRRFQSQIGVRHGTPTVELHLDA
jgi:hypothetical protein